MTTAVANVDRNERVIKRNNVVAEIAKEYNLKVADLYSLVDEHRDMLAADGVHLTPDGYKLLAKTLVSSVKEIIKI